MQGQAMSTIGGIFAENNNSDTAQNPPLWIQSQGKNPTESGSAERLGPDDSVAAVMHEMHYRTPVSGFLTTSGFSWSFINQIPDNSLGLKKHVVDLDQRPTFLTCMQSMTHPSHNVLDCSMKLPAAAGEQHPGNRLLTLLPPTNIEDSRRGMLLKSQPPLLQKVVKSKGDGSCKLFGISLISGSHLASEPATPPANFMQRLQGKIPCSSDQRQDLVSDILLQKVEHPKSAEMAIRDDERIKPFQSSEQLSREVQGRSLSRTCIKVFSYPFIFINLQC